ncbi:MAG: alpha-galactosidase [Candidatus Pseudobacter hemicellulosilyticus]|uniref:Alpha-galactosidase n=1 Tax=Candidatus Pseudobacter hemicellulosilyticus TaxID=3121375 RepID=A0AAJ6BGV0_9BACT|nr:MAG: alpha-galactosidase [Pseudobacter sp.]
MFRTLQLLLGLAFSCSFCLPAEAADGAKPVRISYGKWTITYKANGKTLDYTYAGKLVLANVSAKVKTAGGELNSYEYPVASLSKEAITDVFGKGTKFTIHYSNAEGKPGMSQSFCFYPNREYFLTEVVLTSEENISSNYMAPVITSTRTAFLGADSANRVLRVPFDNDAFVHYLSSPLTVEDISFEVTTLFNGRNRNGLVIGSVTHDTWKTGLKYKTAEQQYLTGLECFGGVTHELTRDSSSKADRPPLGHGAISGKLLRSPKILIGFFADWRRGMEAYGEANALIAPPRKWASGTPFGWNSWGAMADKVNYTGSVEVAQFIKDSLQAGSFENNNTAYIGLDSYWDNFSDEQLKQFVAQCRANGQYAGIYWCPFSDWGGNGDKEVEGTNGKYTYKDIYIYANGKPRKVESLAVDPTHPGTKQRMDYYIEKFRSWGFTYVKLDFINNGTLEADKFYNPAVTTGVQAYNEGMDYLSKKFGEDFFLALSIAPVFPAQYGTSRRISCDTWGAMTEGDVGTTGYMLNSLAFGWWLDRVYPFNDADHILLYQPKEAADYQAGANRARVTSAVITGIYMLGDNFSRTGSFPGEQEARNKAKAVTTNKDINAIAILGRSFYPVEGYTAAEPGKAETLYMMQTDQYTYVAAFNFNKTQTKEGRLSLERLGLKYNNSMSVKELWTGASVNVSGKELSLIIPPQDVRVYRISKK